MRPDELLALARDRRLVTTELHASNDFYGHATILKRYAGLPARRPLKAVVEHGPFVDDLVWDADLASAFPVVLCSSERRARHIERRSRGSKRAIPIGPFTAYVERPAEDAAPSGKLLAFPAHSTHRIRAVYEVERFARLLADESSQWDSVAVCVYWRDVLDGVHRTFEKYGFETVTAGHMFDPQFLPRLVSLLREASAVVTNEFGSHVLYATYENRPVWVVDQRIDYAADEGVLRQDMSALDDWVRLRAQLQTLFADPRAEPTRDQRRYAGEALGTEYVRSPADLRAILADAEAAYRRERTVADRFARRARRTARYVIDKSLAAASSRPPRFWGSSPAT